MKRNGLFEIGNKVIAVKNSGDGVFCKGAVGEVTSVDQGCFGEVAYQIWFSKEIDEYDEPELWWAYPDEIESYSEKARKERNAMTMEEVENIVNNLPGGIGGFLNGWGWMQFAREVEKICQEKNS